VIEVRLIERPDSDGARWRAALSFLAGMGCEA